MGQGRDTARQLEPAAPHHDLLENMKDQLIIVLMKRLQRNGKVRIPIKEIDDTGGDILSFRLSDDCKDFVFVLSKKQ